MRPTGRASSASTAELDELVRSPIIELNRAVAVGMAEGPAVALAIVERWRTSPR